MRKLTMDNNAAKVVPLALTVAGAMTLLTGCGVQTDTAKSIPPVTPSALQLRGSVFGGRQPIAGATIHLYAAGTAGYAGTNTDLLTTPVTTNASGIFTITGDYSCSAGQQMYIVALGGNTGAGAVNPQAGILAALGDCSNLSASTFINMNEVTTVAGVFALAPFMSSYAAVGTSPTNTAGLKQAFNSAAKLANVATGSAGGPALAAGAVAPVATINTIADVLTACVNSTGGTAGDATACGQILAAATPSGGTAPTNTIDLALAVAKNPALNVATLFGFVLPVSPFTPALTQAPNDFTLAVTYGGFSAPKSTTIDAAGNVWVANAGNNSVSVLSAGGATVGTYYGNGLNAPSAVAIDLNGNAWVANTGGSTLSLFTASGAAYAGSPVTVGTAPSAVAFTALGTAYVANSGSNSVQSVSQYGSLGTAITGSFVTPSSLVVDPR